MQVDLRCRSYTDIERRWKQNDTSKNGLFGTIHA
jgi:hypothetical protein